VAEKEKLAYDDALDNIEKKIKIEKIIPTGLNV